MKCRAFYTRRNRLAMTPGEMIEYKALLMEYRALLMEFRALLME